MALLSILLLLIFSFVKGIRRCTGKAPSKEVSSGEYPPEYDRFVGGCHLFLSFVCGTVLFEALIYPKRILLAFTVGLVFLYWIVMAIGTSLYRDGFMKGR